MHHHRHQVANSQQRQQLDHADSAATAVQAAVRARCARQHVQGGTARADYVQQIPQLVTLYGNFNAEELMTPTSSGYVPINDSRYDWWVQRRRGEALQEEATG